MKGHGPALVLITLLATAAAAVAWRAVALAGAAPTSLAERENVAVPVEVAPIDHGRLQDVRVLSGTLAASTRFDVAAKVGGLIRGLNVDLGDEVERGQIVAVLDDDEFMQSAAAAKAELAVREAELAQANAELARVERDYRRVISLHERGVASDVEYDEVTATQASQRAAVALAEARVRQAAATLEVANIQRSYSQVRAEWQSGPQQGVVGARFVDVGDTIQLGLPIFTIVALDPLLAVVSVTERDYAQLRVGQAATLTTEALPGRAFDAQIVRIAPVFREASRQARVELRVDNADGLLRPGMFIRVRIVLRAADAETIVPRAAIIQRAGSSVVFTIDAASETAVMHAVELGIRQDEQVQIVNPPLQGRVVVMGQHLLDDGAPVRVIE